MKVTLTPEIEAKLRAAVGSDKDVSNFTVFDTIALSESPLRKRGGLYKGAKFTRSTLAEMADYVREGNTVPMHTLHLQGDELPVGAVFDAWVEDDDEGAKLMARFFIDPTEATLSEKIDNGTISEVSVGVLPQRILCSECGFDYMGEEATLENVWEGVCDQGHVIGENGVHARVAGLDLWMELSLVSVGASPDAKIQKQRMRAHFGDRHAELLQAGIAPEALMITASNEIEASTKLSNKEDSMDVNKLVDDLSEVKADLKLAHATVADLSASVEAKDARIAELEAQLAAFKAEDDETLGNLKHDLKVTTAQLEAATSFLTDQAKAALAASEQEADDLPQDVSALIERIEASSLKLHQIIPTEPVSVGADATEVKADAAPKRDLRAFKTRR